MILVDANLLLYASIPSFTQHQQSRHWFESQLNGRSRVALPWVSLVAFVRVATHPRIFSPPVATSDVWREVRRWLEWENVWIPGPTERHGEVLGELLALPGVRGDLVSDAHIAALAIEHDLTLCSADRDFAKFPKLRWLNPMSAGTTP